MTEFEERINSLEDRQIIIFKTLEELDEKYYALIRCLRIIMDDMKFLTPEIKALLEELDGVSGYVSGNLTKRVSLLEEQQTKPKRKYKY